MLFPAVVAVGVGAAMAVIWLWTLATGGSPEVREGTRAIWFHITAELLTAAILLAGGIGILVHDDAVVRVLTAAGLGAATYSTVSSPGYYADRGQPAVVAVFALLTASCAAATGVLVHAA